MKTIEERAKEYALKDFDRFYTGREKAVEEGYIAGAKDQKVITTKNMMERCKKILSGQKLELIDKACEWITEHIDIPYEGEFIDSNPVASDYIEWCKKRLEYAKAITDAFKKAMEE